MGTKRYEPFRSPKRSLGDLDAEAAARLITAASDIALVIDAKGVIRDVALGSEELSREDFTKWVGQRWVDTVSADSRQKVEEMLAQADGPSEARWRQVNHPMPRGADLPVRYSAVRVGSNGRVVAVGRDLRALAATQQKLVAAQQNMEREFARLRHAETRYRLLFQLSSEAVLVLDGSSLRVLEANPAAAKIFGRNHKKIAGRPLPELFDADGMARANSWLAALVAAGRADDIRVNVDGSGLEVVASAALFRQDAATNILVRLVPTASGASAWLKSRSSLLDVIAKLPDGFVVTDVNRRILSANAAFVELTQMATEQQVRDEPIDRWLGRHPVDVDVLIKSLKQTGQVRNFATALRGEYGGVEDVEVSAVAVQAGEQPCYGFTIRSVLKRPDAEMNGQRMRPRSVEQLTELVGRVPLKDLVRESTDMIERLCIEAALELTNDNRASAAEILGLSRQGLYSKLRRHGLGDLDTANDD